MYVLWGKKDWPASNGQIHLSVSSNHAKNFSEPTPISKSYWNSRDADAVASGFPNTIHMAWIDSEDGNTSDVFFRTVSFDPTGIYVGLPDDQPHKQPLKLDDFASKIWYEHEFIVDGTILDIRGYGEKERTYDIQINSFFKPADNADTKLITVYGSPNFYSIEGDRGIFFIKKENARWVFGEYGAKATPECPPELMFVSPNLIDPPLYRGGYGPDFGNVECASHYYKKYLPEYMKFHGAAVPSPLIQQTDGISASEVVCNEGLELALKINGRAACVHHETREKLIERGWTKNDNSMLQKVLDLCGCQESGGPCINPIFKWQNKTHYIDSLNCEWEIGK